MFTPTNKLTLKVITLFLGAIYFSGCSGSVGSSSFGYSGDNASTAIPDGQSNGIASPNQFYVGIDSAANAIATVHKDGVFGTNCAVDPSSSLQDIKCIVDIPEGELYFHGVSLIHNVPPGMCPFLRRHVYFFYNQEVGYGPASVTINRTTTDGLVTGLTCSVDGSAAGPCSGFPEVSVDSTTLTLTCIYDNTKAGYANGCLGSYLYTLNDRVIDTTAGTNVLTTTSNTIAWGGSYGSVIGGAAKLVGWPTTANGWPLAVDQDASQGLFATLAVPAPISAPLYSDTHGNLQFPFTGTSIEVANYYKPGTHTHTGFFGGSSTAPYFIDPIDDRNGTSLPATQESYEYDCLDQAHEYIHRIRVYVREWNAYQDYTNYLSSNGATEIPDRGGAEGVATCQGITGPCNDEWDLDDFVASLAGGIYDTSSVLLRQKYFPYLVGDH